MLVQAISFFRRFDGREVESFDVRIVFPEVLHGAIGTSLEYLALAAVLKRTSVPAEELSGAGKSFTIV
jgi:hypothetical protein